MTNNSDNNSTEFIICPHCYTKHPKSINPIFCVECNYRFERDGEGNIKNEQDHLHIQSNNTEQDNKFKEKINPENRNISNNNRYSSSRLEDIQQQNLDYIQYNRPRWKASTGFLMPLFCYGIIAGLLLIMILLFVDFSSLDDFSLEVDLFFITSSFSLIFLLLPVYWVQRYYPERLSFKDRLEKLGLPLEKYKGKKLVREILFGALMGVVGSFLVMGLLILSFYIVDLVFPNDFANVLDSGALDGFGIEVPSTMVELILFILAMVFFVGPPEEVLFRGFVQRSFESKWTKSASTWITAVYFAVFHIFILILQPDLFLFLFIPYLGISLLLGLLRNYRNDIVAAIVAHIVYNIVEIVLLYIIFYV